MQEEQNWYQQGGNRTTGTEQEPEKWLIGSLSHVTL
jgi:hypothetical protein